jgi:hypothetical protein
MLDHDPVISGVRTVNYVHRITDFEQQVRRVRQEPSVRAVGPAPATYPRLGGPLSTPCAVRL